MQAFDAAANERARRRHGNAGGFARHRQHAAIGDRGKRLIEGAGDPSHASKILRLSIGGESKEFHCRDAPFAPSPRVRGSGGGLSPHRGEAEATEYSAVASATAAPGSPGAHLSAFHRGSRPKESFIARVSASGQASWDAAGHVLRMRVSRLRAGKPLAGGLAGRLNPVPSFVLSGSEASL